MEKWFLKNPKVNIKKLTEESGISELLCRILANRQITDPDSVREFVNGRPEEFDGFLMKDMKKSVDMIWEAIDRNEKIRIISDYDVDGVISAVVLCHALKELGANVDFHIPHRVTDGYGLNENLVNAAIEDKIDMIITCDNGVAAVESIQMAKDAGIKVIITDHHEIPFAVGEDGTKTYILPAADAIIDSKQEDCAYPFDKLCGAGVVYKLVQCLTQQKPNNINPEEYLDLVAIATVCDVVDLISENRLLLKKGLARIPQTNNVGLRALMEETKLTDKNVGVYHLGFILGPCVNASGRLEGAKKAVELFLATNPVEAKTIAMELVELNHQRKQMTQEGIDNVIAQVQGTMEQADKVIVAYNPDIHESIAGIVAGKVRERFNLPAIVLTDGEHGVKGSGRSIEEYNLFEEIQKCSEYLERFGGHPMAAGMSLARENVEPFAKALKEICTLTEEDITIKVNIDLNISLENVNMRLAEELSLLEPFGKGNNKPIFGSKAVEIKSMIVRGINQNVLSMKLKQADGKKMINAVLFGEFDVEELKSFQKVDVAYHVDINEYGGNRTIQLMVQNIRQCK